MTTMKPKLIVSHSAKGLVGQTKENFFGPGVVIEYIDDQGHARETVDLSGWKPARVAGPGEVVVQVDDLDLPYWAGRDENAPGTLDAGKLAIRAAKAWGELQASLDQVPNPSAFDPQPRCVKDRFDTVWNRGADGRYRSLTRCGSVVLSELEATYAPLTFLDDAPAIESPITVEVSLPCPKQCGQMVTRSAELYETSDGGYDLRFLSMKDKPEGLRHHLCPMTIPDEPTEAGVKVSIGDMHYVSTPRFIRNGRLFVNVTSGEDCTWDELKVLAQRTNTELSLGWTAPSHF